MDTFLIGHTFCHRLDSCGVWWPSSGHEPRNQNENKVIAHIAVLLTLLIVIGLVKPLTGAMERGDSAAVARVATMLALGVLAMVAFVRSFIAARKARG